MLISPPFLPARQAGQADSAWIDAAMPGGEPGDGAFPLSYNLGWHGGRHVGGDIARAIADGTVAYVRQPTPMPVDQAARATHALNYYRGWTSDGVVVIRHETEIGATTQGAATRVVFFSIYMHLHSVDVGVRPGQRIYRKSPVGQAGHIYGQPGKIHLEIVCDDGNLRRLVGRSEGELPAGADGRSDAVYGELYFTLPSTAQVYLQRPANNNASPAGGAQLGEDLCVGLRYAEGDGPAGARGHLHVTSYRADGSLLGASLTVADGEYNLYRDANTISTAYPTGARPAPTAIYELLRFGRELGPDALTPAEVPHWREVRTPTGQGWVNLNGAGVHKCSDADFPHWRGWKLVDDDSDGNSQCNSATIRAWLDEGSDQQVVYEADVHSATTQEARRRLDSEDVKAKLRKVIGKFPTEWDAGNYDTRFGWLKDKTDENPNPLDPENYPRLRAHVEALQFWSAANLQVPQYDDQGAPAGERPLAGVHWHFDPREFIRHFRMCGWLSEKEMARVISSAPADGKARAAALRISMNQMLRKYCVCASEQRLAHFLAQVGTETGWWQYREELGNERYFRTMYEVITPQEAADDFRSGLAQRLGQVRRGETEQQYAARRPGAVASKATGMDNGAANSRVGGQAGDGVRFRGRGFLQITGRKNYTSYQAYRGVDFSTDPNPRLLATDNYNACDASGFFWVRERISVEADAGSAAMHTTRVGGLINRGRADRIPLHNAERRSAFSSVWQKTNDE